MISDIKIGLKQNKSISSVVSNQLYYSRVNVCGQPVEALDSGLSATIMSFSLFRIIGKKVGMTADAFLVILRDYNQHPIRVRAMVEVEIATGGVLLL